MTVTGVVAPPAVEPLVGETLTHGTLAGASQAAPGVGVGVGVGVTVGVGVGVGVGPPPVVNNARTISERYVVNAV